MVKTRSDIKWLVNEAAALNGQLKRLHKESEDVAVRILLAERNRAACLRTLALLTAPPPDGMVVALPTVRAHRAYGGRGSLGLFVGRILKEAAPRYLDTMQIAVQAVEHFGLSFSVIDDFYRFKNHSIRNAIRVHLVAGNVERVGARPDPSANYALWQWRTQCMTFDDLRAIEDAS